MNREKQAKKHGDLIAELLDSNLPKTEREHAAAREIECLRGELETARMRLAAELEAPIGTQTTYATAQQAAAELRRLHDENELLHKRCQQAYEVGRQSAQDDMDALLRQALEALRPTASGNWTPTIALNAEASITAISQHLENKA